MRRWFLMSAAAFPIVFLLGLYAQRPDRAATPADVHALGPISAVGHGAMLDREGKEIQPTPEFIAEAQRYYLESLSRHATSEQQARLTKLREPFERAAKWSLQEQAYANHAWIAWLLEEVKPPRASTLASINAFLRQEYISQTNPKFRPSSRLLQLLPKVVASPPQNGNGDGAPASPPTMLMSTTLSGAAYVAACQAAGVPTPPGWGSGQWVSKGILSNEFLKPEWETEVFTFTSNSPAGICFALPRAPGNVIALLGIICMSKSTGQACFWDNQSNDQGFPIPKGASVPLSQFAGGAELDGGSGGECTQCHAGENPFLVHPGTALDLGSAALMPNAWYKPMVHPNWLQNPGPTNLLACVPLGPGDGSCLTCHASSMAGGGRFPAVSTALPDYCAILKQATIQTMPPGQAGNAAFAKHVAALTDACSKPPASFPPDADLDCVEDSTDNCKWVKNPLQEDGDGDGVGTACDNCPGTKNEDQLNTDGDQEGDACDLDDDNDFCPDTGDDKPKQDSSVVGFRIAVNCPDSIVDVWGWDGEDSDGDGTRNCADTDDDNDGVPDASDKCPVDAPKTSGIPGFECNKGAVSCPFQVPWDVCMFGGCNELLIKILSVINPNPVVIDKFRIVGTDVYLEASANQTLQQIEAAVLAGPEVSESASGARGARGGRSSAVNRNIKRMEIWSRDRPGAPGRRIATIAEYDPLSVQFISQEGAPALMVTPVRSGRALIVNRTAVRPMASKPKSIGTPQK